MSATVPVQSPFAVDIKTIAAFLEGLLGYIAEQNVVNPLSLLKPSVARVVGPLMKALPSAATRSLMEALPSAATEPMVIDACISWTQRYPSIYSDVFDGVSAQFFLTPDTVMFERQTSASELFSLVASDVKKGSDRSCIGFDATSGQVLQKLPVPSGGSWNIGPSDTVRQYDTQQPLVLCDGQRFAWYNGVEVKQGTTTTSFTVPSTADVDRFLVQYVAIRPASNLLGDWIDKDTEVAYILASSTTAATDEYVSIFVATFSDCAMYEIFRFPGITAFTATSIAMYIHPEVVTNPHFTSAFIALTTTSEQATGLSTHFFFLHNGDNKDMRVPANQLTNTPGDLPVGREGYYVGAPFLLHDGAIGCMAGPMNLGDGERSKDAGLYQFLIDGGVWNWGSDYNCLFEAAGSYWTTTISGDVKEWQWAQLMTIPVACPNDQARLFETPTYAVATPQGVLLLAATSADPDSGVPLRATDPIPPDHGYVWSTPPIVDHQGRTLYVGASNFADHESYVALFSLPDYDSPYVYMKLPDRVVYRLNVPSFAAPGSAAGGSQAITSYSHDAVQQEVVLEKSVLQSASAKFRVSTVFNQDFDTSDESKDPVQQPMFTVTISMVDEHDSPYSEYPVTTWLDVVEDTQACVNGVFHTYRESEGFVATTDVSGRIVVTIAPQNYVYPEDPNHNVKEDSASGLVCPSIILYATFMPANEKAVVTPHAIISDQIGSVTTEQLQNDYNKFAPATVESWKPADPDAPTHGGSFLPSAYHGDSGKKYADAVRQALNNLGQVQPSNVNEDSTAKFVHSSSKRTTSIRSIPFDGNSSTRLRGGSETTFRGLVCDNWAAKEGAASPHFTFEIGSDGLPTFKAMSAEEVRSRHHVLCTELGSKKSSWSHFFSSIVNGIHKATSFLVTSAEKLVNAVVHWTDEAGAWFIDEAVPWITHACGVVIAILKSIGAELVRIYEAFSYIFNWKGYLKSANWFSKIINLYLDPTRMKAATAQQKEFTAQWIASARESSDVWFDKMIEQLTHMGTPGQVKQTGTPEYSGEDDGKHTYLSNKLTNSSDPVSGPEEQALDSVDTTDWDDVLKQLDNLGQKIFAVGKDTLKDLEDGFKLLIDFVSGCNVSVLDADLAKLVKDTKKSVDDILTLGEEYCDDMLDANILTAELFSKILNFEINKPKFVKWLWHLITGESFTLLNVICLAIALPFNIGYATSHIVTGSDTPWQAAEQIYNIVHDFLPGVSAEKKLPLGYVLTDSDRTKLKIADFWLRFVNLGVGCLGSTKPPKDSNVWRALGAAELKAANDATKKTCTIATLILRTIIASYGYPFQHHDEKGELKPYLCNQLPLVYDLSKEALKLCFGSKKCAYWDPRVSTVAGFVLSMIGFAVQVNYIVTDAPDGWDNFGDSAWIIDWFFGMVRKVIDGGLYVPWTTNFEREAKPLDWNPCMHGAILPGVTAVTSFVTIIVRLCD